MQDYISAEDQEPPPRAHRTSYTPEVIVSRSFSHQVVNVHVVGLSNTMHAVFCLNENLQEGESIQIIINITQGRITQKQSNI